MLSIFASHSLSHLICLHNSPVPFCLHQAILPLLFLTNIVFNNHISTQIQFFINQIQNTSPTIIIYNFVQILTTIFLNIFLWIFLYMNLSRLNQCHHNKKNLSLHHSHYLLYLIFKKERGL